MNAAIVADADFRYVADFLTAGEADSLLSWLLREVPWQEEEIVLFGRRHRVPRLVAWYGEQGTSYRYSKLDHPGTGWPAELSPLLEPLRRELGARPNFMLANRYRSGQDAMGWHTDDEAMSCDLIGSVSLGARRRFLLRPRKEQPSVGVDLEHGSLLVMNRHHPHSLPRTRRPLGERVNLSFRVVA